MAKAGEGLPTSRNSKVGSHLVPMCSWVGGEENSCHKEYGIQTLPLRPLGEPFVKVAEGWKSREWVLGCVTVLLLHQLCAERGQDVARWSSRERRLGSLALAAAWEVGWADQSRELGEVRVG